MKKNIFNIIKIFVFLLIFLIIYVFLTELKHPESIDLSNISGIYGEEKNSLDMVYIGGSASFVYWIPLDAYEKFGIASYDYGANTIQPELYKYMIKEMLKSQSPELIILDARAFQYRDVEQPPTSVAYRNVLTGMKFGKNKVDFINQNVGKYLGEGKKSFYFDLNLYHTNKENPKLDNTLNRISNKYKSEDKGFYFVPKAEVMEKQDFETDKITPISEETTSILKDLLEFLKTIDNKVLFVVSPYIETKEHKENFNYIENIVKEEGFNFLDANEYTANMKLNYTTDLYNKNHVNYYGAEKYTNFLANYIKQNYNIPDRRQDEKYSSWNDLLPKWKEKVLNNNAQIDKIIGEENYYNGNEK